MSPSQQNSAAAAAAAAVGARRPRRRQILTTAAYGSTGKVEEQVAANLKPILRTTNGR
jgi:hypothetical protein